MSGTVGAFIADDTDLVADVRAGDDRAFEELYQRYHTRIAAYVRGMVKDHARAEDVTQEVFFSALRRMRETERPIAFKPWVYEIARNACIDAYRRNSRAEELSYDADDTLGRNDTLRLVSSTPGPDSVVESKQRLDDLCGAFGGLSETHHKILVLRELEGLSYREIGERLGLSRPAVESTLFRARRRLTEEYDELVSGRRCERVQAIIAAAAEGMLGARDRRKLARHTATCQACRRHARRLGIEESTPARAKLAALLPIPAFLRRGSEGAGAAGTHGSGLAAQVSSTLGALGDPIAVGWGKALAAAATLAFAGAGAGVAAHQGHPLPGLGHLPVIGAKTVAKPVHSPAHGGATHAATVALRSLSAGTSTSSRAANRTVSKAGGSSSHSNSPTGAAGGRNSAAASAGGPDSVGLPDAPAAPDVTVPDAPAPPGGPATDQPSSPDQPEGDTSSVGELTNLRASAPPEPPAAPIDVSSVVGSGG